MGGKSSNPLFGGTRSLDPELLPKIVGIKCLAYNCWPWEVFSCERIKILGCEECPYALYVTVVEGKRETAE